jgi:hypothetical protein
MPATRRIAGIVKMQNFRFACGDNEKAAVLAQELCVEVWEGRIFGGHFRS